MKKKLLLISLDTVRADVAYSWKFKEFENIRNDSVSFLNTISSSPLTPVSHTTVFTWLQPFNHWVRHLFREQINPDTKTIAEIFKDNGYNTNAIVSCPWMNSRYWFNKWFDSYDDEIPRLADGSDPLQTIDVEKRGTALKRANIVSERAIDRLEKNSHDPFFLFLHFFDAHRPYEAPEKFGWDNCYEEEIAFSLHYLDKVIKKLKDLWIYENTTIICFSDHWEDLNWLYANDKWWEKLWHPEEKWHGCLLYDQTQKVIFTIKDENLPRWENIENQVRLVDILPTILELFGFDYNNEYDWISLIKIIKREEVRDLLWYSETFYPEEQKEFQNIYNKKSVRINNKEKVIVHLNSDLLEIYDLVNDPNELRNQL